MQRYQPALVWVDNDAFAHVTEDSDGDYVLHSDAASKIAELERRLSVAVAEVATSRVLLWPGGGYTLARPDGEGRDNCQRYEDARAATDADPVLRKMIGGA